jgi:hypothetical protein
MLLNLAPMLSAGEGTRYPLGIPPGGESCTAPSQESGQPQDHHDDGADR